MQIAVGIYKIISKIEDETGSCSCIVKRDQDRKDRSIPVVNGITYRDPIERLSQKKEA